MCKGMQVCVHRCVNVEAKVSVWHEDNHVKYVQRTVPAFGPAHVGQVECVLYVCMCTHTHLNPALAPSRPGVVGRDGVGVSGGHWASQGGHRPTGGTGWPDLRVRLWPYQADRQMSKYPHWQVPEPTRLFLAGLGHFYCSVRALAQRGSVWPLEARP